jgi:hypothetical protein
LNGGGGGELVVVVPAGQGDGVAGVVARWSRVPPKERSVVPSALAPLEALALALALAAAERRAGLTGSVRAGGASSV